MTGPDPTAPPQEAVPCATCSDTSEDHHGYRTAAHLKELHVIADASTATAVAALLALVQERGRTKKLVEAVRYAAELYAKPTAYRTSKGKWSLNTSIGFEKRFEALVELVEAKA